MQSWQQKAAELWPECQAEIEEAEQFGLHDLWLILWPRFLAATYGTHEDAALQRFYDFAWWSLGDTQEALDATILGFYEKLPEEERVRAEMHYYLTPEQLESVQECWQYGRTEEAYTALLQELQAYREGPDMRVKVLPKHAFVGISSRGKRKHPTA